MVSARTSERSRKGSDGLGKIAAKSSRVVTMKQVAKEANVSITTVSVALSEAPNGGVPEVTRQRVLAAARRLNYVPDHSARALRTRRSGTLGFITDFIAGTPFAGEIVTGAQKEAWKRGYVLLLVETGGDADLGEFAARMLLERRVEQVIVASWYHREIEVPPALVNHAPLLVNCFSADGQLAAIVPDEEDGGYRATARLLSRERGPVGFINLPPGLFASKGRLAGYKRALKSAGVPFDRRMVVAAREGTAAAGYQATSTLLDAQRGLNLLFCGNDRIAMGAYDAIRERGLQVPRDIAVIGFDNQEIIAGGLRPGLSSVSLPHFQMGERAVSRVLDSQNNDPALRGRELVLCTLVERESA